MRPFFALTLIIAVGLIVIPSTSHAQAWTDCPGAYSGALCDDPGYYVCDNDGSTVTCTLTANDDEIYVVAENGSPWAYGTTDIGGTPVMFCCHPVALEMGVAPMDLEIYAGYGHDDICLTDETRDHCTSNDTANPNWTDQSYIFGNYGNDRINTASAGTYYDEVDGHNGNDTIRSFLGDDDINGGEGDDWLYGGGGADNIQGDAGVDNLFGDAGADTMLGGLGADIMRGGTEDDDMFGEDGADEMHGGSGDDTMSGGDDGDTMYGNDDDDIMNGDDGHDWMYGGDHADDVCGGDGADRVYGRSVADCLCGGDVANGNNDGIGDFIYGDLPVGGAGDVCWWHTGDTRGGCETDSFNATCFCACS